MLMTMTWLYHKDYVILQKRKIISAMKEWFKRLKISVGSLLRLRHVATQLEEPCHCYCVQHPYCYGSFLITPVAEVQSELLARTSPTIYDVLIALCGGLAGIVALCSRSQRTGIPTLRIIYE